MDSRINEFVLGLSEKVYCSFDFTYFAQIEAL
jgi:hypothetical protein